MKKFIISISLLIFILSINVYAQEKVGQAGCGFLDVAAGARACGMGGAFTVIGQDASALFYNPACIGEIDANFDLSIGVTQWISDINYIYLAAVYNTGLWGKFGFSVISPDYGEIYGTRYDSLNPRGYTDIGLLDVSAFCAGVAYALEFTDKFTVGGQIKYVSQHLGENDFEVIEGVDTSFATRQNEISVLSYDFGLLFYPGLKSFAFGMSVRNFSPRVTYELIGFELPLTFALGVGMDILDLFGEYPDYSFNIAVDMLHPRDWMEHYNIGGEFAYRNMFFLRAGYKFNYYEENLNVGVGINYRGVRLDYSYSKHDLYDFINRASVGFAF
jgi:hypothetical protein